MTSALRAAAVGGLLISTPLHAAETGQLWLTVGVTKKIDPATTLQLEVSHRFRPDDPRGDQWPVRLAVDRRVTGTWSIGGGVSAFATDNGPFETRLHQQLSLRRGVLRARTRIEQRLIEDAARIGWRLRQRIGVEIPLRDPAWAMSANGELFFALRDARAGGPTGLTQVRAALALERRLSNTVSISGGYLYQHSIVSRARDNVAHVPQLGLGFRL